MFATVASGVPATSAPSKTNTVKALKVSGVPASAAAGEAFKTRTLVRNTGKKTAKKAKLTHYLSSDKSLSKDDLKVGSAKIGKLKAGAKKRVTVSVAIPSTAAVGSHFVLACVAKTCRSAAIDVAEAPTNPVAERGTLTGTLNYSRATPVEPGQTVDVKAEVKVAMRYEGPYTRTDELQSTGSTYTYGGKIHSSSTVGDCTQSTETISAGSGTLAEVANPYDDEIFGGVVLSDLSEISLTTVLKSTISTKVTKTGPEACSPGVTETTSAARTTTTLELTKLSSTSNSITYRVSSFTDDMTTGSFWDRIDGNLTLQLS